MSQKLFDSSFETEQKIKLPLKPNFFPCGNKAPTREKIGFESFVLYRGLQYKTPTSIARGKERVAYYGNWGIDL
ncbi:hypothetical protein [Leptolyngbya sp. FACHB-16]|uniref:hypothetical protein n=1 Tax=unclassified Leptolyngbya TaxID=2650499 RepID=UPI0019906A83|nr:hypothetical protein [Leptolyngbya sp. FACHB-16]MBD2153068.1 hypothetical protein [Leptolyngbya sp. FACHB-16]